MTVTSNQSGTQAATITTEHALGAAITAAGVYVLVVDTANMQNGDAVELRIKTKCRAGGTKRQAYFHRYEHAQGDPIKYSVPVPIEAGSEFEATLKQTVGTGRNFDWNILSL